MGSWKGKENVSLVVAFQPAEKRGAGIYEKIRRVSDFIRDEEGKFAAAVVRMAREQEKNGSISRVKREKFSFFSSTTNLCFVQLAREEENEKRKKSFRVRLGRERSAQRHFRWMTSRARSVRWMEKKHENNLNPVVVSTESLQAKQATNKLRSCFNFVMSRDWFLMMVKRKKSAASGVWEWASFSCSYLRSMHSPWASTILDFLSKPIPRRTFVLDNQAKTRFRHYPEYVIMSLSIHEHTVFSPNPFRRKRKRICVRMFCDWEGISSYFLPSILSYDSNPHTRKLSALRSGWDEMELKDELALCLGANRESSSKFWTYVMQ